MNVLEFVASIIGSLAWPALVIGVVLMFRSEIQALISNVKRGTVRAGGFEVEFELEGAEYRLNHVRTSLPEGVPTAILTPVREQLRDDGLTGLVNSNPTGAILAAFERLHHAFLDALDDDAPVAVRRFAPPSELAKYLVEGGSLPDGTEDIVDNLARTRNVVAHFIERPDSGQAARFVEVVSEILELLFRFRMWDLGEEFDP